MKTTVYSIAQTAVLIHPSAIEPQTIYLDPTAQDIYIGGSDVSTANGIKLTKSVITPIFCPSFQSLYAITGTGTHPIIKLSESP